ncbi:MAG: hypothetical protein K8R35_06555 [Bacteroidales bacterium]|nr:hypothetical protein [Bacteroidales bacterium]
MTEITGLSNKVLEIDLSKSSYSVYTVPDEDTRKYLGGKGLALKLLYDRFKAGTDALSPDNIIVFHTGAYMGTGAPCSGRFSAVSKSPLTGIIATSSCGGPFGMALKTSGWDGLLIKGASDIPVWIEIDSNGAKFNCAKSIWGKDSEYTQNFLKDKGTGTMAIGPAGENLVNYANIVSGDRFFGRTGMGAVLGSKKIKAITAKGREFRIVPKNKEQFKKIRSAFIADINKNEYTSIDFRKYGTASAVRPAIKNLMLPVNNFRDGTHPDFENISGDLIENNHTRGFSTCKPCSIMCGHKGKFGDKILQVPEYETIGLLGTSLGIFDPVAIAEWNETCKLVGIDTISAGATLAWAMEAGEKGVFRTDLKFGISEGINRALNDIGYQKNSGLELGKGTRWLSEKYGGEEYAMHSKGLEVAAYDPRGSYGHGLGLATANRGGCHLSATMMSLQAFSGFSFKFRIMGNAYITMFMEDLNFAINSLQTCQFTIYAVFGERYLTKNLPRPVIRIMNMIIPQIALQIISVKHYFRTYTSITGIKLNQYRFRRCGKRGHLLERYMNTREGITSKDDTLPHRFLYESRISDKRNRHVPLHKMLRRYYWYRGYDKNGIPKPSTLKRWGITVS